MNGLEIAIKKEYGDFTLETAFKTESRRIGILGASGCGKSQTLKALAGIIKPDEGFIANDGRVLFNSGKKICLKPQERKIGYLFQNYALFPNMTVEENISIVIKDKKEKNTLVKKLSETFQVENFLKKYPRELSGGQQQRVAIARIMAAKPDTLLLDEPFSALDSFLKEQLQGELFEMLKNYEGRVVLVSHNRDEIYRFSDELICMDGGRVIRHGKLNDVFKNPENVQTAILTGCKNIFEAERIDAHTFNLKAFNVQLKMKREIPENTCYIGVRAHHFIPVWKECISGKYGPVNGNITNRNHIPVKAVKKVSLPFEDMYEIGSEAEGVTAKWLVQREGMAEIASNGMPDFLHIPEEAVMIL